MTAGRHTIAPFLGLAIIRSTAVRHPWPLPGGPFMGFFFFSFLFSLLVSEGSRGLVIRYGSVLLVLDVNIDSNAHMAIIHISDRFRL